MRACAALVHHSDRLFDELWNGPRRIIREHTRPRRVGGRFPLPGNSPNANGKDAERPVDIDSQPEEVFPIRDL